MSFSSRSCSLALVLAGTLGACSSGFEGDPLPSDQLPGPGGYGTASSSSSSGAAPGSSSGGGTTTSSSSSSSSSGAAPSGPRVVREAPNGTLLGQGFAASNDTLFFVESGPDDTQLLKSCPFTDCAEPRTLGNALGLHGGSSQLTLSDGKIYYPVQQTQTVRRMNLDGTIDEEVVAPDTACPAPRRIAPQVVLHEGILYAEYNCTVDGVRTQRVFRRGFGGGLNDRLAYLGATSRPADSNTNWVRTIALDSGRLFAWQETATAGAGMGLALGEPTLPAWSYPAASVDSGHIVPTPTQVFFVDDDTARLKMCPSTGTCAAPAQLLADRNVRSIARAGSSLYVATTVDEEATVYRCSIDELVSGAGCATTVGTVQAPNGQARITLGTTGVFLRTSPSRFDAETPARIWQLPL